MTTMRLEVTDAHGTVALVVASPNEHWIELSEIASVAVGDLMNATGLGHRSAIDLLLAELIRRVADDQAYERVCRERGVLPL